MISVRIYYSPSFCFEKRDICHPSDIEWYILILLNYILRKTLLTWVSYKIIMKIRYKTRVVVRKQLRVCYKISKYQL